MPGWTCPACGRQVPSHVGTCRCGCAYDGSADAPLSSSSSGGAVAAIKTGAFVVVALSAVIGGAWYVNRGESAAPPKPGVSAALVSRSGVEPELPSTRSEPVATPSALARVTRATSSVASAAGERVPAPPAAASTMSLEDVVSRAMPAVVRVEAGDSFGTGFFIAPDTILTNVHVVSGNSSVTIRRPGGATSPARVDTTASELDIAVLRVSTPDPRQATLTMGSGMHARAGQEVIALGTPLGLQNTVTRGIVSAVRQVGTVTLVQTDAAINPGNSGGPLIDRSGNVIGITTMGMRSAVAQGLSFAVAIDHAAALLEGRRPTAAAGTPITSLNQAMAPAGPSEADTMRQQAARAYEQTLAGLAQAADSLDRYWDRFKTACYRGRVAASYDRDWFAIWDPRAMQGAVADGCESNFADIQRLAAQIRDRVVAAEEAARRADVYPGTRRDLRRKYRLDYSGWDR